MRISRYRLTGRPVYRRRSASSPFAILTHGRHGRFRMRVSTFNRLGSYESLRPSRPWVMERGSSAIGNFSARRPMMLSGGIERTIFTSIGISWFVNDRFRSGRKRRLISVRHPEGIRIDWARINDGPPNIIYAPSLDI